MSYNTDWIPTHEETLISFTAVWKTRLSDTTSQTAYGWVAAECTATVAAITTFSTAFTAYHAAPTKINLDVKNAAKAALVEALRKFARERVRNNPKMSVAQREELGIFPPDTHPTPVPVPDKGPEVVMEIDADLVGWVFARYLGGKPSGVAWVEVAWEVSDVVITRAEALTHLEAIPHNPWKRNFGADEQGRTLYLAMRYATHGGSSPWSVVHSVTIP